MSSKRILFISAPIGAGHIRAAQAVSQILTMRYACETELCNVFDFFPPAIGQAILTLYLKILTIFPALYGTAYGWGNQSRMALFGRELISRFLAKRMLNYINEFQPAVIVCTHATPAGLVAWLKKKGLVTVPTAAIVTDFVVHRLWVYPEIDYYFVAHLALADYLRQYGIAADSIAVTGIPVSNKFSQPNSKEKLMAKLKLAQGRKNILIMGGGAGVLPIDKILNLCNQIDRPLQLIAIAGKNQPLHRELVQIAAAARHPVKVLGYIDNVHEYMSVADLLISKPGGMSSAEALTKAVPLVIFRPIPGQEEANTQFLLDGHVALRADSLPELHAILARLLFADNDDLLVLHRQAALLGRPNAAADIAEIIAQKAKLL
ncbi:Processive diacylglycerol beta-glucosyltransferase [Sporomusa ovata DSM 2662]|uniref:Monogalactosyldiacylglycerol synthase n=1 Tax=Sporomusa ovata TaxID=2378 RepID=A0A0U1KVK8_9FIRM|nr:glycosyltransferase [Sporomusa ovata]EQB29419.1 processive diacylglycerol glucosyltransferase [Sporomusa ovata DSM 2662]CQR71468.1 Monogalactosyldiacylglycerol synthase [Sporomusa ovata]